MKPAWQKLVGEPGRTSDDLARYLFGEWHISIRYMALSMFTSDDDQPLDDPERFIDAWIYETQQRMHVCRTTDWTRLRGAVGAIPKPTIELSRQSQALLDTLATGASAWGNGSVRLECTHGLQAAALVVLQGKPVPNEPVTGLPYVWDAATRTLSVPADLRFAEHKIEPLILKELKR